MNHLKIMLAYLVFLFSLSAIQGMEEEPERHNIVNYISIETQIEYQNPISHINDDGLYMDTICKLNILPLFLTVIIIGFQFL